MRKTTLFLAFVFAFLVLCIIYFAVPQFKAGVNNSFLGPLSVAVSGMLTAIYQSPVWKTYIAPTRWAALWGGVITLAVVVAFSKTKSKIMPKVPKKIYPHEPVASMPQTIPQTPAATVPTSNPSESAPAVGEEEA